VRLGLAAVEERDFVATRLRDLDQGWADEPGAAEDQDRERLGLHRGDVLRGGFGDRGRSPAGEDRRGGGEQGRAEEVATIRIQRKCSKKGPAPSYGITALHLRSDCDGVGAV
jgi:hypothetical protein